MIFMYAFTVFMILLTKILRVLIWMFDILIYEGLIHIPYCIYLSLFKGDRAEWKFLLEESKEVTSYYLLEDSIGAWWLGE